MSDAARSSDRGELDARRCISYLTIEHKGAIPLELRALIGNRIFGCDDCQLVCPWNRFAQPSAEADFLPRHALDRTPLLELFGWSEAEFLARTEGSALRRINYDQWQRNLAVALGNAPYDPRIVAALRAARASDASPLVAEHIDWAIGRQLERETSSRKLEKVRPVVREFRDRFANVGEREMLVLLRESAEQIRATSAAPVL